MYHLRKAVDFLHFNEECYQDATSADDAYGPWGRVKMARKDLSGALQVYYELTGNGFFADESSFKLFLLSWCKVSGGFCGDLWVCWGVL